MTKLAKGIPKDAMVQLLVMALKVDNIHNLSLCLNGLFEIEPPLIGTSKIFHLTDFEMCLMKIFFNPSCWIITLDF